jgi:hypothetical protein
MESTTTVPEGKNGFSKDRFNPVTPQNKKAIPNPPKTIALSVLSRNLSDKKEKAGSHQVEGAVR